MSINSLQPYPADLDDWAYSEGRVRKILADAHVHYEAQVKPLGGLARPEPAPMGGDTSKLLDALQFVVRYHDQLKPADIERLRSIIATATGGAA